MMNEKAEYYTQLLVNTDKGVESSGTGTYFIKAACGGTMQGCHGAGGGCTERDIDRSSGRLGANIFSSVCGVVESVTDTEIVIRKKEEQPESYVKIPEGTKAEMVAYAGITGMGGAGFPTAVKLSADLHGGYILVNAAECEPGTLS